jgi:hypothetical protein
VAYFGWKHAPAFAARLMDLRSDIVCRASAAVESSAEIRWGHSLP